MKIIVAAFSKLKAPGLREAANYYLRLTRTFNEIEELEFKAASLPDKSASSRERAQENEATTLLYALEKKTSSRRKLVLLDERGSPKTTQGWAQVIESSLDRGTSELVFCIGGSAGFADSLRERADLILGFGPQTLPHELARVVLLEQIFRSLSVLKNHPYHNDG